jgi:hypothetical protein
MSRSSNDDRAGELPPLPRPFIADSAPIGTVVQLGRNTPDERVARSEFHRYLFQYFEQLVSGQTGWGVDFNVWLEMTRGWKHHGRKRYERIMSIEEMLDSDPEAGEGSCPSPRQGCGRDNRAHHKGGWCARFAMAWRRFRCCRGCHEMRSRPTGLKRPPCHVGECIHCGMIHDGVATPHGGVVIGEWASYEDFIREQAPTPTD